MTNDYDYGVSTEDAPPVILCYTLEEAIERKDRLERQVGHSLVLWRKQRTEWEKAVDLQVRE